MSSYKQKEAGEWVQPIRKGFKFCCCDCGLVHRMDFRLIEDGRGRRIQFRSFRDERATGQIRRYMKNRRKR